MRAASHARRGERHVPRSGWVLNIDRLRVVLGDRVPAWDDWVCVGAAAAAAAIKRSAHVRDAGPGIYTGSVHNARTLRRSVVVEYGVPDRARIAGVTGRF